LVKSVTYTAVPKIPLINPGDNLTAILIDALRNAGLAVETGDVFVIAQKIVSKAEGRYRALRDVVPSEKAMELAAKTGKDPRYVEIILSESSEIVRYRPNVIIAEHRLGYVMANAGIDQSNIGRFEDEHVLLLPNDPERSAAALKAAFDQAFGVKTGVVINDSFGRPWRMGVTGVALAAAGIPSLKSMIGQLDLFGRPMQATEIAIADEIAAGASLLMGQGAEGLPAVLVRGLRFGDEPLPASALLRPRELDMFR
jgi:coenzyme F420-0:L-glutamate ligase / coenzyme F420-1:gamma-L-glutamate ligase